MASRLPSVRLLSARLPALIVLLVAVCCAGCAIDRTRQSASYKMRADLDRGRDRSRDLEKDLVRERQRIDAMQNKAQDARKRIAESGASLESFLEELGRVRGELSSANHASDEAARFSEDMDMRISEIERRFMRLEAALIKAELLDDEAASGAGQTQGSGGAQDEAAGVEPAALDEDDAVENDAVEDDAGESVALADDSARPVPSQASAREATASAEEQMFQSALIHVEEKSWDRAGSALQNFIKSYPESQWRVEALYLLGECLFYLERYRGALRQYQKVVESDKQAKWSARALFRQALCLQAMGMVVEAKDFLHDVVGLYPQSPEAAKARMRLEGADE